MITPRIPEWRIDPEQVWLRCKDMTDLNEGEVVVHFMTNKEQYVSFVPKRFLDRSKLMLQALVIADVEGGLLVDIPTETLTSGPRIFVPKWEQEAVLVFSRWDTRNGS